LLSVVLGCGHSSASALHVETTIALGDVAGRIDHLAADLARKHVFIAELGNGSVAVVDVAAHAVLRTIDGLSEPQGVAYEPSTDTLFVANGGDGSVRLYSGTTFAQTGAVDLHDDADNVRIDAANHRVLVGYGNALAAIDIATHAVRTSPLDGHPESFQIDVATSRAFVNVPRVHAVVSLDSDGRVQQRQSIALPGANFPLALDDIGRVVLPLRHPAALWVMPAQAGTVEPKSTSDADHEPTSSELCDDADDVFYDARRKRLYVSCGDGHLDVFERTDTVYARIDHLATARGARTSLFVAEWDRLFLAVPKSDQGPAAVWVMEPN
jgi:YVTN family beta-propeller protein